MTLKRVTLTYLAAYLVFGGVGLAFAPDLALDLLLATEEYDDTMPRLVGMFMIALGGFIGMMVYAATTPTTGIRSSPARGSWRSCSGCSPTRRTASSSCSR